MASSGVVAVVVTLAGIVSGVATFLMGTVIFASFVGGVAFTAIGAYLVSEAF